MTLYFYDGGWFRIHLVAWLTCGFGAMYMPNINQLGFVFGFISLVITWDDAYEDEPVTEHA